MKKNQNTITSPDTEKKIISERKDDCFNLKLEHIDDCKNRCKTIKEQLNQSALKVRGCGDFAPVIELRVLNPMDNALSVLEETLNTFNKSEFLILSTDTTNALEELKQANCDDVGAVYERIFNNIVASNANRNTLRLCIEATNNVTLTYEEILQKDGPIIDVIGFDFYKQQIVKQELQTLSRILSLLYKQYEYWLNLCTDAIEVRILGKYTNDCYLSLNETKLYKHVFHIDPNSDELQQITKVPINTPNIVVRAMLAYDDQRY